MSEINWLERLDEAGIHCKCHPVELSKLVELAEGRDILEVGSYAGGSTWCMAHTAKSIIAVDTFKAWTNGQTQAEDFTTLDEFLRNTSGFPNISHFIGTSRQAGRKIKGHFDMIFLDAMHDYASAKADIAKWWPRVKPGGVFCMHDYGHDDYPGVKKAADEVFGDLGVYNPPMENWVVTLRWERKP